ncbi:translation elongation factor Ts [Myroides pelagicus]|uniref:Elongation factor Ts n=1 Tax=Myroides pelagicus TaxID=270914 RepID=A0A7K1GKV5_9FLAO|nr:translation elongation factor Ts [Myroides pelagicus]MEC4112600.1 translation elongation factor Ts [Myroides pelagicus]MTH29522.1 elongation factor Ts [Myroides pelagicus]
MANITAAEVNKLRQHTGAGMMDCKKALVEAEGDFDKAIEVLRKKGQKVAANRSDRESSEGVAISYVNDDKTRGVVITLNCETDFVGKNEDFVALAKELAQKAINFNSKEEFLASKFNDALTVAEKCVEQTGVIGEKIEIGSFEVLEGAYIGTYIHGNKIAAITAISEAIAKADELTKDISMQVASMGAETLSYKDFDPEFVAKETEARIAAIVKENEELVRLGKTLKNVPQFISYSQITDEVLKQAEEDAKAELKAEGKPENIWERIIPGKIQRFISDNTTLDQEKALLDQNFIKDEAKKVGDYVKGFNVEITGFKRASLG